MIRIAFITLCTALWLLVSACTTGQSTPVHSSNLASITGVSTAQKTTLSAYFDASWGKHTLWNDGQAEVATYEAARVIYGRSRSFDYTFATVKETFNREFETKTDNYRRDDLFEVFKQNMFCRIPTRNYPYHFLTSVFVQRYEPTRLFKYTNSSQEWCGNTFKEFKASGDEYRYTYHSYWDGQGDGEMVLAADVLFEDQLPLTLRSLKFEEGLSFSHQVLPSQISSKVRRLQPGEATFRVRKTEVSALNGQQSAWEVQVSGVVKATFWFGTEYPNPMLKMSASNGRNLTLKSLRRWAYWMG